MTRIPTRPDPEQRIGVPEAARALDVHPDTVRSLIHAGQLPALRVGQRFKIRRGDLKLLAV